MRRAFPGYYPLEDERIRRAWESGLVVPDTNVLLDTYRLSSESAASIISTLRYFSGRLFLPYQVAAEYHRLFRGVIAEQAAAYRKTAAALRDAFVKFERELESSRHPFLPPEILDALRVAEKRVFEHFSEREQRMLAFLSVNPLRDELAELFEGRVAEPVLDEVLAKRAREGAARYAQGLPPGFNDKSKPEPECFGDYFIWCEILDRAESERRPVIFVTNEKKDDWVDRPAGRTCGPHPKLVQEFRERTEHDLIVCDVGRFLDQAEAYLQIEATPAVREEVADLKRRREEETSSSNARWTDWQHRIASEHASRLAQQFATQPSLPGIDAALLAANDSALQLALARADAEAARTAAATPSDAVIQLLRQGLEFQRLFGRIFAANSAGTPIPGHASQLEIADPHHHPPSIQDPKRHGEPRLSPDEPSADPEPEV